MQPPAKIEIPICHRQTNKCVYVFLCFECFCLCFYVFGFANSIDVTWCLIVFIFVVFGYQTNDCLVAFSLIAIFCLGLTNLLYHVLPKVHVIVKDIHTRAPDGADIA